MWKWGESENWWYADSETILYLVWAAFRLNRRCIEYNLMRSMEDTVIQMGDMNIPLSFRFYSKHNFADVCAVWHQNRSSSHILTRQFIRSGTYQLFWWIEAFCMSTMWNERSNGHHEMWTTTTNQYHFYSIRISLYCRGLASAWKQWDSNNSAILCSFSLSRFNPPLSGSLFLSLPLVLYLFALLSSFFSVCCTFFSLLSLNSALSFHFSCNSTFFVALFLEKHVFLLSFPLVCTLSFSLAWQFHFDSHVFVCVPSISLADCFTYLFTYRRHLLPVNAYLFTLFLAFNYTHIVIQTHLCSVSQFKFRIIQFLPRFTVRRLFILVFFCVCMTELRTLQSK